MVSVTIFSDNLFWNRFADSLKKEDAFNQLSLLSTDKSYKFGEYFNRRIYGNNEIRIFGNKVVAKNTSCLQNVEFLSEIFNPLFEGLN